MKFAVIGAGITGMSAAWLLSSKHEVWIFEAERRLGGHANTVDVDAPDGPCAIDTGFIVYNTKSYPNLIALFDRLDVPTAPTDMGFAVSLEGGGYEYSGSGLGGLFGQASNIVSPSHWRLTREIFRFFREASAIDPAAIATDVTLGDWLAAHGYSQAFIHAHIVPMGAAIWSTPAEEMLAFPFAAFARFFANHGLLQAFNRPAWRTVAGGSRQYVARLMADTHAEIRSGEAVVAVTRAGTGGCDVRTASGLSERFDGVILACHADEARRIAAGADAAQAAALAAFRYAENTAVLHTDARQMPLRRKLWSAWNYIGSSDEHDGVSTRRLSVSYWMNKLQPLATSTDYFVTLNPVTPIAPDAVALRQVYRHPMFDAQALDAQMKLWPLQGRNSIWMAGSYFGYGFHEDGIQSGLAAAEHMSLRLAGEAGKVERPWAWDKAHNRIKMPSSETENAEASMRA